MHSYALNIARHGFHYAKVALPTGTDESEALDRAFVFAGRFPASEGFSVTLSRSRTVSEQYPFA